ncbi:nucleotide-sugar transporter-domain-containing protein [Pavlovales sp. CCMP2436]|nr:nucleotide-sugar transporter-domain-containing protein [Pavlovales sp. CCMP2436]|mmetsp:Transcript_44391/g.102600  ORF Transcript_44391/g.102600 Transcript_44391/m.102600 type:complete len:349 (-) Transcript_44391:282-1328(-)
MLWDSWSPADGPTRMSTTAASFALYVGLWTAQTLLVRAAVQPNGSYAFDYATVCLCVECVKLGGALLALALGADGGAKLSPCARVGRALSNAPASLPFAAPSILYCAYNLLQFVNLALVSAPTFRTVINIKVVFTALFARCLVANSTPTVQQWLALLTLAAGCAVSQLDERLEPVSVVGFCLICLQGSLSSLAGVFTQWLMQHENGRARTLGFWERGVFLYAWGAVANLLFIAFFCPAALASPSAFFTGYSTLTAVIVLNGALAGFSTALLLRLLSAVAKEFANAAEILTTALAARALFGTRLPAALGVGAVLVVGAMATYERAKPPGPKPKSSDSLAVPQAAIASLC